MKTHTTFKVFSCIIILTMVLSLSLVQNTASAQSTTSKHVQINNSSLSGVISDDELPYLKLHADGTVDVMLQLASTPTGVVYAQAIASGDQNQIASASTSAISAYNQIKTAQTNVINAMKSTGMGETILYQVHAAYNGIAVHVSYEKLAALKGIAGVKAIHVLTPKTLDNSQTVPLIGAASAWELGTSNRGEGIKVGVIDTGIDYLHTDFGGKGTGYNGDFTKVGTTPYPTTKVAGGYDFAGDSYDADPNSASYNPIPTPDYNPMDCNGHGTHVAGTIAGYGVNTNGTTYTGTYGSGTNFSGLRVGPGVAPLATLYGLRVFGCSGSTDLVTEAIDWAMDPNSDGDTSDHLDVINMSLGSDYGFADDPDSVAANNATEAGVIVVTAAGNASDTHYIVGSPSVANGAISVASSVGNVKYAGFQVTSPNSLANIYQATPGDPANVTDPGITNIRLKLAPNETQTVNGASYTDGFGCNAAPANYYANRIAVVARGSCAFYIKALNAQNAGAVGIIIYNHSSYVAVDDSAVNMDMTGDGDAITIPNMHLTNASAQTIVTALKGDTRVYGSIVFSTRYTPAVSPADTLSSFSSRGSRLGDSFLKPDISAPGDTIVSAGALTGNQGAFMSGTSMATPVISGVMALLRELHPTWSVEELKALAMNTATHDLTTEAAGAGDAYTPAREGAGRVDVANAVQSKVVAFNAVDTGAVSVSFGVANVPVENTDYTATKAFKIENKAGTALGSAATYAISYVPAASWTVAGVSFTVVDKNGNPVTSVTIGPSSEQDLYVKMDVNGSQLTHTMDTTMEQAQNKASRSYETEAGGYITLTPNSPETASSDQVLRLPVYAVVRPTADMHNSDHVAMPYQSGNANIDLTGTGIATGTNVPTDIISLASAYELKYTGTDEHLPASAASANIQYIGVMSDVAGNDGDLSKSEIYFAISSFGNWTVPSFVDTEFDILIDTNGDGAPDYLLYDGYYPSANGDGQDVFLTKLYNFSSGKTVLEHYLNGIDGQSYDMNEYNTNIMVLPVTAADLGLSNANSSLTFWVESFTSRVGGVDVVGGDNGISFDALNLAVDTTEGYTGIPLYEDQPGYQIPVSYNYANASADGVQGILVFHHHNNTANTAEVVQILHNPVFIPEIMISK